MDRDYTRKVSNCLCWDERETTTDREEECPERPITERIKSQERQLDRREMLLFMFLSFTSTEGFNDWSELTDVYT